jgi:flagellar hook-associated protein 3 FlgL
MTRVASLTQHTQLVAAMQQHQQRVAIASLQVATGKRGEGYDDLGLDAVRQVKLSNVLARETAYADAARRAAGRLSAQDLHLGQLRDAGLGLRDAILGALAAGEARGLGAAADATFGALRGALNADHAGRPLFGGGLAEGPAFTPTSLAELTALPATSGAFANGPLVEAALVAEGTAIGTGFTADAIGAPLAEALRQLGALLPLDGPLDAGGTAALEALLPLIENAVAVAGEVQAENGARAAAVDEAIVAADARAQEFELALAAIEDVDPAEAITRLQAEQTALQASYQVLAQIGRLSLVNFL